LAVIPWSPLGGGLLTGKYVREEAPPEGARFGRYHPVYRQRFTERIYDVVEPLHDLTYRKNVPLSRMALAWVTQRPGVTSSIIGPRTMEQLEDNLKSLEITFEPEDLDEIDAIIPPGTNVSRFYEAVFAAPVFRQL
jgi:aryl-alcohol dehydrogenase-like predicted oxidoreductase